MPSHSFFQQLKAQFLPQRKTVFDAAWFVWLLLAAALFLRFWQIEYIPFQNDADELAYVYAGQSLLERGTPISWSSFQYPEENIIEVTTVDSGPVNPEEPITLVGPWFDHPFLLPLLQGAWVKAWGYGFISVPPSLLIRLPMLVISGVTLWLVYALARELYGHRAGLFSLALISFSPVFIFGQRMVTGENVYVPMMLAAVYLAIRVEKSPSFASLESQAVQAHQSWRRAKEDFSASTLLEAYRQFSRLKLQTVRRFFWPILLAGTAGLAKVTGLLAIPVLACYFIFQRKYLRADIIAGAALFVFGLLYFGYGYLLGWEEFLRMLELQSHRFLGWSNPAFLLSHPGFHHFVVYDLSYYVILLLGMASFVITHKDRKDTWLFASIIGSVALVWITSAEQDHLGWYKLSLFTLLAIASGGVVQQALDVASNASTVVRNLMMPLVLLWLTVGTNIGLVRFNESPLPENETLRLVVIGLLMISFAPLVLPLKDRLKASLLKASLVLVVIVLFVQGFYIADNYYAGFCDDRTCPNPEVTVRGLVKNFVK